jgi:hypothetical protein
MLRLSIFLSGLLVTPVADTVWWHTDGGSVTQRSDQSAQTCTLTIENNEGRFAFVWDRTLPAHIMAAQPLWRFAANQSTTAAMRIGNFWLDNGNGTPNMTAIAGRSAMMFVPDQPFDNLLSSADEIVIRTPDTRQFGILLTREKMTPLVAALRKCRASLGFRNGAP